MKYLVLLLFSLIVIVGCASSPEQLAKQDHEWCASVGIDKSDSRYPECRMLMKQHRAERDAQLSNAAMFGAMQSYQTNTTPVTCHHYGNFSQCQ